MTHDMARALDAEYILPTYARYDITVQSALGSTLTDLNGKKYIDFTSGIGVNSLGWCDEGFIAAVTDQIKKFQHISNYYISPVTAGLAEKLVQLSQMKKVFFSNSGAEANEGAIKTARKYSYDKYGENRYKIITLTDSFHGRTVTTLAATGQDVFHTLFGPFTKGFIHVPMNDKTALENAVSEGGVCAVLAELIQGEGGVNLMDADYASYLAEICEKNDMLLIFDEIQTGIGRTGKMFAHQHFNIKPDIITVAKGLGGGFPIGAFLCGEKCASVMGSGNHGSTFGGNPVAASAACEVLDRVSNSAFLESVIQKGGKIKKAVAEAAPECVKNIRGCGLMIGFELKEDFKNKDYAHKMADAGLLVLTAGNNVIRLLPPLNISDDELTDGINILVSVLKNTI